MHFISYRKDSFYKLQRFITILFFICWEKSNDVGINVYVNRSHMNQNSTSDVTKILNKVKYVIEIFHWRWNSKEKYLNIAKWKNQFSIAKLCRQLSMTVLWFYCMHGKYEKQKCMRDDLMRIKLLVNAAQTNWSFQPNLIIKQ